MKELPPVGTRVRKTTERNEYDRIPKGLLGTVEDTMGGRAFYEAHPEMTPSAAKQEGRVWVIWDNQDRCFMPPDRIEIVDG